MSRVSLEVSGSPGTGRAQSEVIGVALLLGVTVIALGALTAGIGTMVQENAASTDADRVADGFDDALRPVETTGVRERRVSFAGGSLRTVERNLWISGNGTTERVAVDGLVYERGDRRVTFLAGAIVRGEGDGARIYRPPPITASRDDESTDEGGVLVVGAPRLNATMGGVSGEGGVEVRLRTDVSHDRTDLGTGEFRVSVETATPGAWVDAFDRAGASSVTVEEAGDLHRVEARFDGDRTAYLVVHDMGLEVGR